MSAVQPEAADGSGLAPTQAPERSALDAALDCVIGIDDHGRVTYFNPSAERTFGYRASDAVGRELADVVVPPADRDAHRRGLARYLSTGEGSILGRRIELLAIRADGSEFPVELTVTRVQPPAGPGFVGFVRDITARLQAEEELRSAHRRVELIANEQASLRRVATLVARQASPQELFAVAAKEVAQVLGVRCTAVIRYEGHGGATAVGAWGEPAPFALGARWSLDETVAAGVIWRSQRPASVDVADFHGSLAEALLGHNLRSATGVPIVVEGRLWGAMLALEHDREALPAGIVSRLQSFTELLATALANASARSELIAAQRRVIEAADAARERLTRDIHDGAQQRLVNSLINLQRAQQKWASDPGRARELLDQAVDDAHTGVESLRELAAGIHPAILSDLGLAAALEALVIRCAIPVSLEVGELELSQTVAVNAYFFCSEALTNVVKHAAATAASVRVELADAQLRVQIRDDGIGGARIGAGGSGLVGLGDRIGALGGRIELSSSQGAGTTLTAYVPVSA
ncbi:MAG: PAS domain S-box protein [Solirubrobacteraceae bacterium]|jgi:PAS domain S-box-containing protein